MITGYPIISAAARAALTEDTAVDCATGMSISAIEGVSKEEAIRIRTITLESLNE
jgi:hypothetical protein